MTKIFTKESANTYLAELALTENTVARAYLLNFGYSSSSFEMPEYYGASGLSEITLEPINWDKNEKPVITRPLNFLTPKGSLSWRSFNLLHPYIYIHIVNEITSKDSWKTIKGLLSQHTLVNCYSTPKFVKEDEESTKVSGISRWIQMAENDLIKDSVNYSFLTITDIKSFYPSIYTHSISWAIHGKEEAKQRRFETELLGNKLDKLFQNSRDGQTNGIPVGSMVSDIVAEIILKDIDKKLSKIVADENLEEKVLISRYRDDFRILSKTSEQGKQVLRLLSKILDEYNLNLNSEKTKVFEDIIEGSFREWSREISDDYLLRQVKYLDLPKKLTASLLKDILLKTYQLQKKYSNGRSSITLLSKLTDHLSDTDVTIDVDKIDIHTTISILRKLALIQEEVSAQTYLLLDILLRKIEATGVKQGLLRELLEVIKNEKDHDYQVIWLYRLCLSNASSLCLEVSKNTESQLIDLLSDDYRKKTATSYDYEIFPSIPNLKESDKAQLQKFKYVNSDMLTRAYDVAIDREHYDLFRY